MKITTDYQTFEKYYKEKSEYSGKPLQSDLTGYRALDIIQEVFEELAKEEEVDR